MFAKPQWTTGRAKKNKDSTAQAPNAQYPALRGSIRPPPAEQPQPQHQIGFSRQEHLDSFLNHEILGRSTMKVSSDDTTYDTVFSTVSGNTLILRIHFPSIAFTPGISSRAPEMKLTGVEATHPWLGEIGTVTGFAPISSDRCFRDSGVLLGAAVKDVVQEFQLNPPTIIRFTDKNLENMQPRGRLPSGVSGSANSSGSGSSNKRPPPPPASDSAPPSYEELVNANKNNGAGGNAPPPSSSIALPVVPSEFPELEEMDREKLDELLSDELAFLAFCNSLPYTQQLDTIVSEKSLKAERLAKDNLAKQAELQELHESTRRLHDQLISTIEECRVLEAKQDSLQEKPDEKRILKELHRGKKDAMDESERIAENWLSKSKDDCVSTMGEFCDVFLEKRKVHHLRAAKIQVLTRQQQQQPTTNGR